MDELFDGSFVLRRLSVLIHDVGTQAEWAKRNGFSAAYVSDVIRGRREISDHMAEAIGFRRMVKYGVLLGSNEPIAVAQSPLDSADT